MTTGRDIDFDPYAADFADHYDTIRGQVRLALLHEQVGEHLERGSGVLDIGGGAGHLAVLLATDGHEMTVLDPSAPMLELARQRLAAASDDASARLRLVPGGARDADDLDRHGAFDAVLCHAVAPYVTDLGELLDDVVAAVRPGGLVSVVVKNRDALAARPALEGRWQDALDAFDADGDAGGLGVRNRAHGRDELVGALADRGGALVAWYGVRVFSDAVGRADAGIDEVLPVEREAGRRDPYRAMARLLHVVARRTS